MFGRFDATGDEFRPHPAMTANIARTTRRHKGVRMDAHHKPESFVLLIFRMTHKLLQAIELSGRPA
jgi:hypothetical protein